MNISRGYELRFYWECAVSTGDGYWWYQFLPLNLFHSCPAFLQFLVEIQNLFAEACKLRKKEKSHNAMCDHVDLVDLLHI